MWVFPLYGRKTSRFDRLHARKVSTFFPQMLISAASKETHVRGLVRSTSLSRALSLPGSDLEFKRP